MPVRHSKGAAHTSEGRPQPRLEQCPVRDSVRRWLRSAAIVALVIATVSAAYLVYRWSMGPEGGHLSGSVRTRGTVRTQYQTRLHQSVSPGCGAALETADWRGASFVSSQLALAVDSEWGIFHFASPFPDYTYFSPDLTYSATVVKFLAEETQTGLRSDLDMNSLVKATPKNEAITFARSYDSVEKIMLHGPSEIFIEQFGKVPFGAWNPVEGVPLSVVSQAESFTVTQRFKGCRTATTPNDAGKSVISDDPYRNNPVLDLIGKPILVWTAQSDATVFVDDEIATKSDYRKGRLREYVALVLRPAFSMRIAAFGPTDMLAPQTARQDGSALEYVSEPCLQRLTIANGSEQEKRLSQAKKYIEETGTTVVAADFRLRGQEVEAMYFSYPRLPERCGVSLWGDVSELLIERAKGAVVVDGETTLIGAPSELRVDGIRDLSGEKGFVTLSAAGACEFAADLKSLTVDGKVVGTRWDTWESKVATLGLILSTIFLLGQIVLGLTSRLRAMRQG